MRSCFSRRPPSACAAARTRTRRRLPTRPLGQNPPTGAAIDYWLPADAKNVSVEIRDTSDKVLFRTSSDKPPAVPKAERYFTDTWTSSPSALSAGAGAHRYIWNLRYPRPQAVHYDYSIAAVFAEGTPIAPEGSLVLPGDYRVVLNVDGKELHTALKVAADPRVSLDADAVRDALAFSHEIETALQRDYVGYGEMHAVGVQINKAKSAKNSGPAVLAAIAKFEDANQPLHADTGDASLSFDNIGEVLSGLQTDIEGSDRAPSQQQRELLAVTNTRLDQTSTLWERIKHGDLAELNTQLKAAGLAEIVVPAADQISLDEPPESKDLP